MTGYTIENFNEDLTAAGFDTREKLLAFLKQSKLFMEMKAAELAISVEQAAAQADSATHSDAISALQQQITGIQNQIVALITAA